MKKSREPQSKFWEQVSQQVANYYSLRFVPPTAGFNFPIPLRCAFGIGVSQIIILIMFLCLAGCAGKQSPVLYPNDHMKSVGEPRAQSDIEECSHLADAYVKANPGAKVVGGVIVGGAGGAIIGGAVGAVTGSIGRGSLVGGVAGATSGLVRGIYKASQPSPVYKAFVNRCLRDKGYDPIGWE